MATCFTENKIFRFILLGLVLTWIFQLDYQQPEPDFSLCLIHQISGMNCYGCGFLRGVAACMHLDFHTALQLNPLNIVTIPLIGYLTIQLLFNKREKNKRTYAATL